MHWNCSLEIQKVSKKHREKLGTIIGIEAEVSEVRYRPKLSLDELEWMAAFGPLPTFAGRLHSATRFIEAAIQLSRKNFTLTLATVQR